MLSLRSIMPFFTILIHVKSVLIFFLPLFMISLISCEKEKDNVIYTDQVRTIKISDKISIDNGVRVHDPNLNLIKYEDFLKYISNSDRFMIVTQKEFPSASSSEKVIISLRYDIDDNINAAVKCAYRESKYNIKSTYYILHSANYYGSTKVNSFKRNNSIIGYIRKIQDDFQHEIGWHNDLVTLQVVYNLDPKSYLKTELNWLRANGINIYGTVAHGSGYCYKYRYVNTYFWNHTDVNPNKDYFYNWETVMKDNEDIIIEKDDLDSYDLLYDANLFTADYLFADCNRVKGKLWHMGMVDFDTIPVGKKVIILIHPEHWD
jgi:hypothetical protein